MKSRQTVGTFLNIPMGVQNVMLLLTALYQFKVHDNFMERLRRSRFVPVTL